MAFYFAPKLEDLDWPRCAECDELPVENFEVHVDNITGKTYFVATCHGDIELVEIPNTFWVDAVQSTIEIGLAFNKKRRTYKDEDNRARW